ncbi:MAG: ATP-binding protein [Actinomycetota bacterium]
MSIRNKLIFILAIPLAALALVGALGFRGQSTDALRAAEAIDTNEVTEALNDAVGALGMERLALVDPSNPVLDAAAEESASTVPEVTDIRLAEAAAVARLHGIAEVEDAVVGVAADLQDARTAETAHLQVVALSELAAALRSARAEIPDALPTANSLSEVRALNLIVDLVDRQDAIWVDYLTAGEISDDLAQALASEATVGALLREQVLDTAPELHTASLLTSLASPADVAMGRLAADAIARHGRGEAPVERAEVLETLRGSRDDWNEHVAWLQQDVASGLADRSVEANDRQNLYALLGTLGLLVLFGLIYVVYRSVVHPLNRLLEGAQRVAGDRLPSAVASLRELGSDDDITIEPLPATGNDELTSVVTAFNDVQFTAFDLAVEQARSRRNIAETFVNLGRRNQKLLQRMLGVISDLETDEKSPDKLEQLFHLDHMATRMRRNAESLLVVAGTATPRQWSQPVPAEAVVRGALAEVQDYQRIEVLRIEDAPITGAAVADISHLLAELLENALQYSSPETRVRISAQRVHGDYRIVISDDGFGMTPDELADHNLLISQPPRPDEAPTRFLGLFVVGHLADRHGIQVVLVEGTTGGTDARITLPAALTSEMIDAPSERHEIAASHDAGTATAQLPVTEQRVDETRLPDEPQLPAEPQPVSSDRPAIAAPATLADALGDGTNLDQAFRSLTNSPTPPHTTPPQATPPPASPATAAEFAAPIAPTDPAPTPGLPQRQPGATAGIDFGDLPELRPVSVPTDASLPMPEATPAPVAPSSTQHTPSAQAPAMQAPTVPEAPVAAHAPALAPNVASPATPPPVAAGDLPVRTPRETLARYGGLPEAPRESVGEGPTDPRDLSNRAAAVSSNFASFQSAVDRSGSHSDAERPSQTPPR